MATKQELVHKIRAWKRARLAVDNAGLGYPTTNVLHPTHGIGEASPGGAEALRDADEIESIVVRLPVKLREAFEAFHLGLVCGRQMRKGRHTTRAIMLGVSRSVYYARKDRATELILAALTCRTE